MILLALAIATSTVPQRIALAERASYVCQGEPTEAKSEPACRRRDVIVLQLEREGWCYGQDATSNLDKAWRRCHR